MDIEDEENLRQIAKKFINWLRNYNKKNGKLTENPQNIFNLHQFQNEVMLNFFHNKNILKKRLFVQNVINYVN